MYLIKITIIRAYKILRFDYPSHFADTNNSGKKTKKKNVHYLNYSTSSVDSDFDIESEYYAQGWCCSLSNKLQNFPMNINICWYVTLRF